MNINRSHKILTCLGMDYWPKDASIIQVDMNSDRIGLTKKVTVGICGDAKLVAQQLLNPFSTFQEKK